MRGRKHIPGPLRKGGRPKGEPIPPKALPRCPAHLDRGPQGMAQAGEAAARDRAVEHCRPRRLRRLLPGLIPLGGSRAQAEGDADADQDTLRLHPAVALALDRQQADGADGPLHDRAGPDTGRAHPAGGGCRCRLRQRPG